MSASFNPFDYRHALAEQIQVARKKGSEHVKEAEANGTSSQIGHAKYMAFEMARQPLKLARWSEAYHRARLLTRGNYRTTKDGKIREEKTGLSTEELADIAKLKDSLDTYVDEVLKILPELHIPKEQYHTAEVKSVASQLLWMEREYGGGLTPEHARTIHPFVQIFGLEEELRRAISKKLDTVIKQGRRSEAEALLSAYPVLDKSEIDKRLRGRFYPMKEGLQGRDPSPTPFKHLLERPEDSIPADLVASTIAEHATLLSQDVLKHPDLYWFIKHFFTSGDNRSWTMGRWLIRGDYSVRRRADARITCHLEFLLANSFDGVPPKTREGSPLNAPRLEFQFSCDADDAEQEALHSHRYFTTTNLFRCDGVYLGTKRSNTFAPNAENRPWVRLDVQEPDVSSLTSLSVQKVALQELTDQLFAPEKDFHRSIDALKTLAERHSLPNDQVENLITAVKEFGTYTYRKVRSDVGDCLITPGNFDAFCRYKFGLDLESARYGEYHPEWGSSGGYDPYTFFHQVSVYGKRLVIDWTATQYAKFADEPIPFIYEVGAIRGKLGPLYKQHGETPNIPFINDPQDPLYRVEPPISYGI